MDFTLDTDAGRPAYQQIESQVTDAIVRGTLGPGDRLPPERDLALTLGVSRMTVRQAFDALARKGLVERGVGRGTFVTAPRVELDRTERVAGFSEQMERAGLEPSAVLVPYSTQVLVARRCECTWAPIVTEVVARDSTHDVDDVGGPGVENVCVALAVPADVVALARHV